MATLSIFQYAAAQVDGQNIELGSLSVPRSLQVDNVHHEVVTVPALTTVNLFDYSSDLASFKFLWISSDFDLMMELTTDAAGAYGVQYATQKILGSGIANKYGIANMLGSNVSYGNYTHNFGGGTLAAIDKVLIRNLSSTQAAKCVILAAS